MELVARNVEVSVGRRALLAGIDVRLRAGELCGLIGPSGAGKSTLIRAMPVHWAYVVFDELAATGGHGRGRRVGRGRGVDQLRDGTTFSIGSSASRPHGPDSAMAEEEHARGRVLVVDDDEWCVFLARRILEGLGYRVEEAGDGPTALGLLSGAGSRFAFVLLDFRMPGMDGVEVVRRLRGAGSDVGIILCTGYPREQVDPSVFSLGRVVFLEKPFGADDLRAQIARLNEAMV